MVKSLTKLYRYLIVLTYFMYEIYLQLQGKTIKIDKA